MRDTLPVAVVSHCEAANREVSEDDAEHLHAKWVIEPRRHVPADVAVQEARLEDARNGAGKDHRRQSTRKK